METALTLELVAALSGSGLGLIALEGAARARRLAADAVVWRLVLPADLEPAMVERLVLALHGTLRPWRRRLLQGQPWLSIELVASAEMVELQMWAPAAGDQELVRGQVEAALPGVQLVEGDALESADWQGLLAGAWLIGRGEGMLRTDTPTPGLAAVLGGLQLSPGERAVVQILAEPCSPRVQRRQLAAAERLVHGRSRDGTRIPPSVAERARASRLQAKAGRPLYATSVRLLAAGRSTAQAERRIAAIAAGWHQFTTAEMHFQRRRGLSLPRLVRAVRERRRVRIPAPTLLNTTELSSVLAMTPEVARAGRLAISATRRVTAPAVVPEHGIVLGVAPSIHGERSVAVPLPDLARHAQIIGPTGVGKSTLLAQIAIQAIEQGAAVVVIDGKDELADLILPHLNPARTPPVAVLDAADRDHAWSVNPLRVRRGDVREVIADDVLTPIRELFSASWGPRTESYLRLLLLTMLEQAREWTLLDVVIALHDDELLYRIASTSRDPVAAAAWRSFFAQSEAARGEILLPLRHKLASLLVGGLRGMLGGTSTIDIDDLLNRGGVLLPRFSKARIGEDTARLGASLFMTMVWQAIRRRAAIPPAQRRPVIIIADEFADIIRLSVDFEAVLATARSLNSGLVMGHQALHQLTPSMRHAVLANARTRCIYPVGAEDARVLARELDPHLTADHLRALPAYHIAASISAQGHTSAPFTARTLPLPTGDAKAAQRIILESQRRYTVSRTNADAAMQRRLKRLAERHDRHHSSVRFGRTPLSDRLTDRPNEDPAEAAQPGRTTTESDRDTPGASR